MDVFRPPFVDLDPELALALAEALAQARRRWPSLQVSEERFSQHALGHLRDGDDRAAAVRALHAADLLLACGCLEGDAAALAALEERLTEVPAFLATLQPSPAEIDDVRQRLRERLLVGDRPRIADYSGRGALASWLRVAAIRIFSNLRRAEAPRQRAEHEAAALELGRVDPELGYMKQRYVGDFQRALAEAFTALPARERTVLRLKLLDGLNIEKIGALHGVHRATVARWIEEACAQVLAETRRLLRERLRVDATELQSLYDLVASQLEISLAGLLRSAK